MSATENAIDDAIRAHVEADGCDGVVTGWIAVVTVAGHDGEADTTRLVLAYPGGELPWPMALGLVEMARLKLHADYTNGDL